MKISVDDKELLALTETQKNVIKNEINEDIFEEDMKRRIKYILIHKYEQCFKRLKSEWEPKLKESGVQMIPTNEDSFCQLVFSHAEYKSRKQLDQLSK